MINIGGFRPDPKPEKRGKKTKKPIKKKSEEQKAHDKIYSRRARVWLMDRTCVCCWQSPAEQVHHAKGRKGYADEWARDREISLLHDQRFWKALCAVCHERVERNPEYAMERGLTETRADILWK